MFKSSMLRWKLYGLSLFFMYSSDLKEKLVWTLCHLSKSSSLSSCYNSLLFLSVLQNRLSPFCSGVVWSVKCEINCLYSAIFCQLWFLLQVMDLNITAIQAVFLYYCSDCPSCPTNAIQCWGQLGQSGQQYIQAEVHCCDVHGVIYILRHWYIVLECKCSW